MRSLGYQKEAYEAIEVNGEKDFSTMVGCTSKKIRPWWFKEAGGPYGIRVYYGNRVLDINGKSDVIVGDEKAMIPKAIDWLLEQVEAGAFDQSLNKVVEEMSARRKQAETG
ncbi:hypothetical protein [Magnetospira sp. QH-2]|uniref:hypothetical protein n=1 Tax=Magnetospira sp. (strain QH-2) TaxID=1288970 RepID=UPI0003E812A5|nr:hypothetical protein [Magnetospira sp. QH-2]CCQ72240.1 protein of unknown function [Magnetospira sp. QH-2]